MVGDITPPDRIERHRPATGPDGREAANLDRSWPNHISSPPPGRAAPVTPTATPRRNSRPVQRWIRGTVLRSPVQNCHGPTKSTSRPPLMRIKPTPAGPIWIEGFGSMLQTKMRNEVLKEYNNQRLCGEPAPGRSRAEKEGYPSRWSSRFSSVAGGEQEDDFDHVLVIPRTAPATEACLP